MDHEAPPHPFVGDFEADAFERRLHALAERRPFRFPEDAFPADFKHSSVLVCFWRDAQDVRVLMTRRAATLRGHPGQMSFPGGRLDDGEDAVTGALRETEEEVGIPPHAVRVLGRLDDAWSGAGHRLVPVVGWLDAPPRCRPNPAEVESIHTPTIATLVDPNRFTREGADLDGDIHYNDTLRWEGGQVFGLSTDLLIEAIQWGLGQHEARGRSRLDSLRSWLRMKARQEASATS